MENKKKTQKKRPRIHSNRIRMILKELEMTQVELADLALSGDVTHLSKIISGKKRCISLPVAIRISRALKLPVESVFIYKDKEDDGN